MKHNTKPGTMKHKTWIIEYFHPDYNWIHVRRCPLDDRIFDEEEEDFDSNITPQPVLFGGDDNESPHYCSRCGEYVYGGLFLDESDKAHMGLTAYRYQGKEYCVPCGEAIIARGPDAVFGEDTFGPWTLEQALQELKRWIELWQKSPGNLSDGGVKKLRLRNIETGEVIPGCVL